MHVGHPNRRSQLFQFRHRHLRVWKPAVQSLFKMPHISSARRLGSQGWIGVRRPCHYQALVNGLRGTPLSGATGASSRRSKSFRRTLGTPRGFYSVQRQPGYLMLISWDSSRALGISCCLETLRSHFPVSQNDGNVLIIMVQFYHLMGGEKTLAQPLVRKARP